MSEPTAGKGIVDRKVVRIVTPGTVTDEALLSGRQDNLLATASRVGKSWALAWMVLSSGRFLVRSLPTMDELESQMERPLLTDKRNFTPPLMTYLFPGKGPQFSIG